MKKTRFLLPFLTILVIVTGCKKEDSPSFVDDYNAPLTEEKGTEYNGDYFPLAEGYYWNYTGTEQSVGQIIYSGGGMSETESIDETVSVGTYLSVLAMESVSLNSGTYNLYPMQDRYEAEYGIRYFEKTDEAVYFRAFGASGETPVEVKNPLFLKTPLVVGDSWEAQPSVNLETELDDEEIGLSLGDMESSVKCKVYVVGTESTTLDGQSVQPVRLDERVEADIKVALDEPGFTGAMKMNIQITNNFYLLENVGIIKQKLALTVTSTTTASAEGQKYTIKMNLESEVDLNLDSYNVGGTATKSSVQIFNDNGLQLKVEDHPTIQKAIDNNMRVLNIVKKMTVL